ncbi:neuroplastin [Manduca sexta]|nr:neuroplastin [Manduca sexta]
MLGLRYLSLALLFLASAVPTKAQDAVPDTAAQSEGVVPKTVTVLAPTMFKLGHAISLNCSSDVAADKVIWKKNGTEVEKLSDLAGRHELKGLTFEIAHAKEDDFGNYTCAERGVSGVAGEWQLLARAHAKLPTDTNVVEGQKLKLQCKLIGKPYPPVTWTFTNQTDGSNATEVTALLGSRVLLQRSEQGVEFGELVVEAAERGDAGIYTCTPQDGVPASTRLRVKDMYAALWPFLGICVEVFVLCAIILVYEKRRTKPEQDDSDTDNHDQKKS